MGLMARTSREGREGTHILKDTSGGDTNLEGLHKGPEQDADGVALTQQLDESRGSEELQEAHVEATRVD